MENQIISSNDTMYSAVESRDAFTLANLVFKPEAMAQLQELARVLANDSGIVPEHFNKKPGDVLAIIMQAGRWGLEPITVLQSTFVLQGKIGYEAKIIQSVASANGGIVFESEYYGDWRKVCGKFKKIKKTKQGKHGSYQIELDVPDWTPNDEIGVGIRLKGTSPDGRVVTMDVDLNTCYPRHSTNWTYDPQTQIHYTAVKRWVRRYAPHLGAGIRDYDDMKTANDQRQEKVINPTQEVKKETINDSAPSDIDDMLNSAQPEPEPAKKLLTQFEDMSRMISEVQTPDGFENVRDTCVTVVDSGELSEQEVSQIRNMLDSKRAQINKNLDQNLLE